MTGTVTGRPVVAGVDNSESARTAVLWAADEAMLRGRGLRLIRALDWPAGAPRPDEPYRRENAPRHRGSHRAHATSWSVQTYEDPDRTPPVHGWGGRFRDAAEAVVVEAGALAAARHPQLEIIESLVDGKPVDVLRAESEHAAMLVLGSRRLSSLTEMLTTGSIAAPVAAHALCPVAVVREREHDSSVSPSVVVGVDGSARSEAAIAYAFDDASRRGAFLTAVLVVRTTGPHVSERATADGEVRLAESLAGWKAKYPDITVRPQVTTGHTVKALVDKSEHALSLVVGTRGFGGFRGMVLGSVSHGLIHHARCPLVVVPSGDA